MPKKPLNAFRNWINFTRSERKAAFFLCTLVILLCLFPLFYDKYLRPKNNLVVEQELINQLEPNRKAKINSTNFNKKQVRKNKEIKIKDLNQAQWADFVKAGINTNLANKIVNYRKVKNGYHSFQELEQVYTIEPKDVTLLKKYFFITEVKKSEAVKNNSRPIKSYELQIIDINLGDSLQLISIKGIGPSYSSRILKYRKLLGGFHTIEQIKQVYGIHDSVYQKIKTQLTCSGEVSPLKINKLDVIELAKHPYISYKKAKLIVAYRKQHGSIKDKNQLKKAALFTDKEIKRILPYAKF